MQKVKNLFFVFEAVSRRRNSQFNNSQTTFTVLLIKYSIFIIFYCHQTSLLECVLYNRQVSIFLCLAIFDTIALKLYVFTINENLVGWANLTAISPHKTIFKTESQRRILDEYYTNISLFMFHFSWQRVETFKVFWHETSLSRH